MGVGEWEGAGARAVRRLLGHLLGLVGVVRHEEQLLVVGLLGAHRALARLELVVEPDALLLQALDDLLVRAAHLLRILVLGHRPVQPRLQLADLLHDRVVLGRRQAGLAREVLQPVVELVELSPLLEVGVCQVVVLAPQLCDLLVQLRELVLIVGTHAGLGRALAPSLVGSASW